MASEDEPLNLPGGPIFSQRLWSEEVAIARAISGEPLDNRDDGYVFSNGRTFKDVPYSSQEVVIPPSIPANSVAPVVSGLAVVGSLLTCTTGTWSGYPSPTYSYQWKSNGVDIGGATSNTYTTISGQSSTTVTCSVTATNSAGSATTTSNGIVVTSAPANTVAPVISGTSNIGSLLTSNTGTWTGYPSPSFSYQWKADGVSIGGATSGTYTIVSGNAGKSITCSITATNSVGSESATSNSIAISSDAVITALFASGEQGAWYDPSDFSTMFQDDAGTTPVTAVGQSVKKILDKSGRANHATQADTAKAPVLRQDGNSKYYLEFDGVDDSLSTNIFPITTLSGDVFIGQYCGVGSGAFFLPVWLTQQVASGYWFVMQNGSSSSPTGVACGTPTYRVNGVDQSSPTRTSLYSACNAKTTVGTTKGLVFGTESPTSGISINGYSGGLFVLKLYSLIVRGALSTTQEITDTETWVAGKTGVTL